MTPNFKGLGTTLITIGVAIALVVAGMCYGIYLWLHKPGLRSDKPLKPKTEIRYNDETRRLDTTYIYTK